jgi:hypothetical protein
VFERRRIERRLRGQPLSAEYSASSVDVMMAFRLTSAARLAMLALVVERTLARLAGSDVHVTVADASDATLAQRAADAIGTVNGLDTEYERRAQSLPAALESLLERSAKPCFAHVFEDQVIAGLTPGLLAASATLLRTFEGLVDLVLIERAERHRVDEAEHAVVFDRASLEFRMNDIEPVGVARYGEHSFAIVENRHYGFFFNTIVANRASYLERLRWFRRRVSADDAHAIELASGRGKGPRYSFIAVPFEAISIDVDDEHTDASRRGIHATSEELSRLLQAGYGIRLE